MRRGGLKELGSAAVEHGKRHEACAARGRAAMPRQAQLHQRTLAIDRLALELGTTVAVNYKKLSDEEGAVMSRIMVGT